MSKFVSHSIEETEKFAKEWLADVSLIDMDSRRSLPSTPIVGGNDKHKALIVGLSGHLGAGKTAFVKCVAKVLGVTETVTSPTFVIMKIYPLKGQKWQRLIHVDAYRLENPNELEVLNLDRLITDKGNLIMIEWPENVGIQLKSSPRVLIETKNAGNSEESTALFLDQQLNFEMREGKCEIARI